MLIYSIQEIMDIFETKYSLTGQDVLQYSKPINVLIFDRNIFDRIKNPPHKVYKPSNLFKNALGKIIKNQNNQFILKWNCDQSTIDDFIFDRRITKKNCCYWYPYKSNNEIKKDDLLGWRGYMIKYNKKIIDTYNVLNNINDF
jgi:hypothetical protein